jgi:hypothetical protein
MYIDRVSTANYKAFSRYEPAPYDGSVLLVLASERKSHKHKRDPRLLWGELARGGYIVRYVLALDSGLALKSPHVEQLAAWINEGIGDAGRTEGEPAAETAEPPALARARR